MFHNIFVFNEVNSFRLFKFGLSYDVKYDLLHFPCHLCLFKRTG
jgi:hypothetical protein